MFWWWVIVDKLVADWPLALVVKVNVKVFMIKNVDYKLEVKLAPGI